MLHIENARVDSEPVESIEGRPNSGIFRVKPLMRGDRMALLEIRLEAGASSAPHAHSHESVLYVVSGRLRTVIGDEAFELGPGDACRHPQGAEHRVEALEDTLFVEIKSPPTDFQRIFGRAGESPGGAAGAHAQQRK